MEDAICFLYKDVTFFADYRKNSKLYRTALLKSYKRYTARKNVPSLLLKNGATYKTLSQKPD